MHKSLALPSIHSIQAWLHNTEQATQNCTDIHCYVRVEPPTSDFFIKQCMHHIRLELVVASIYVHLKCKRFKSERTEAKDTEHGNVWS